MATESTTSLWSTTVFESTTPFDYTKVGGTIVIVGMYMLFVLLLLTYLLAIYIFNSQGLLYGDKKRILGLGYC